MSCNNSTNIFLLGLASSMATDIRTSNIDQQQFMTFAYAFSVTSLVTFGIISNIISLDIFRRNEIRSTTVGIYLLVYSCCSLFGLIMLECRLFQLISSLRYIPFFFICCIISGLASIFTRICLWLNGCIAIQRSLHAFEPNGLLNRIRSRPMAFKQILVLIICVFLMHIHELISRVALADPVALGKFVCQIKYPPALLKLNEIFSFCHLCIPFVLHLISIGLIITVISRRRAILHQTTYWQQSMKQFRTHRNLFLSPILAMACTLPQLIISLKFSCVNITLKWLLRFNISANLILYIPQSMTFFLFIYYSDMYFQVFRNQTIFGKCLRKVRLINNRVTPNSITNTQTHLERLNRSKIPTNRSTLVKQETRI